VAYGRSPHHISEENKMVETHELIPKHTKISDSEKEKLLETYQVSWSGLPKINKSDPAIAKLNVKVGDVIRIDRESKTAGKSVYYRAVVEG